MSKVSIIVPVYNTSKYVEKCLDSLAKQTIKNTEIIIVNDGSTDNSEYVIKQWMKKNNQTNVKYLKKENGGLSDARNYGVLYANGKYISFIDSDDYIDIDLFKNLEKYMNQDIDLIKFKMKMVNEEGKIIQKVNGPVFEKCTGEQAFKKLCTEDMFIDPACIYLYRKDFFVNNRFEYQVGTYHEDFGLTPLIIINAKSFVSTNEYGYNYLQRDNSITKNDDIKKSIKKANDLLNHYDNMIDKIESYDITQLTRELIKKYYTNSIILKAVELEKDNVAFNKYIKELKKRKVYRNIKPRNIKQLVKRILLRFSIKSYLKMR